MQLHVNEKLSHTNLDQGNPVSIRAWYRNIDKWFFESWSLAFFRSTIGAIKSIIRAEILVLCIDVLALLTWMIVATSSSEVNMVGVKTGHRKKYTWGKGERGKWGRYEEIFESSQILHLVTKWLWNIQDVSAGSVRNRKLWQLWELRICGWLWMDKSKMYAVC